MGLTVQAEQRQKSDALLANAKTRNTGRNWVCKAGDVIATAILILGIGVIGGAMVFTSQGGFIQ